MTDMLNGFVELGGRRYDFLEELSVQALPPIYDWLRYSQLLAREADGTLIVYVIHDTMAEWIETCVLPALRPALDRHFARSLLDEGARLEFWLPDAYSLEFWEQILDRDAFVTWRSVRFPYLYQDPARWALTVRLGVADLAGILYHGDRVDPCVATRALDRLQAEGVAAVERRESGGRVTYRLRLFAPLPLLTPDQVARLKPRSQKAHARWLPL